MAQIEGLVNVPQKPKQRKYNYHIEVHWSADRDTMMKDILKYDADADFKIRGRWNFRVKTILTSAEISKVIIYSSCESVKFRKCVFF